MKYSLIVTVVAALLASCTGASLTTDNVRTGPTPGKITGPGVIYSLPKTFVTVTVSLGEKKVPTTDQKAEIDKLKRQIAALDLAIKNASKEDKPKLEKNKKELVDQKAKVEAKVTKIKGLSSAAAKGAVLADPEATYRIDYDHAPGSSDTVEISTSEDGLLSSVSTTTRDDSATVAASIFEVAGQGAAFFATGGISAAVRGLSPADRFAMAASADPEAPKADLLACEKQADFSASFLIDPLDPVKVYEGLRDLSRNLTAVDGKPGPDCIEVVLRDEKLNVLYDSRISKANVPPDLKDYRDARKAWSSIGECEKGICYRRLGTLFLEVRHKVWPNLSGIILMRIPQAGDVGYIDFQRRAFVENTAEATFTKGMLTKLKYTDPSEVTGLVSIPVNALKAIFGIPAAIFDTGKSQAEAEKAIAEAELAILKAQVEGVKQQHELQKALEAAAE